MKLYNCKVRLSGSVANEVRKDGVTGAEIEVLRVTHGADAVLDIEEAGEVERSGDEERERLSEIYLSVGSAEHKERVERVLGPRHFDFSADKAPAAPKAPARKSA